MPFCQFLFQLVEALQGPFDVVAQAGKTGFLYVFDRVTGQPIWPIDEKPVHFFFLIVAPPLEVSNQYLPVLGKIAQFSKESDVPQRLLALQEPREFMQLLEEKGV